MNLAIIIDLLTTASVLIHILALKGLVHLLKQLILVGFLFLLALVEFVLSDVFEHIGRLHMHYFLLFR